MLLHINQLLVQRYTGCDHGARGVLPDYTGIEITVLLVLIRQRDSETTCVCFSIRCHC